MLKKNLTERKKYKWILSIFSLIGVIIGAVNFYNKKPNLLIETNNTGKVDWNNAESYFNIRNYGEYSADSVKVTLDLNYWRGQSNMIKRLPPNESYKFPFRLMLPTPDGTPNPFLENFQKIRSGEKAGIGVITIDYKWLKFWDIKHTYSIIIDKNGSSIYQQ